MFEDGVDSGHLEKSFVFVTLCASKFRLLCQQHLPGDFLPGFFFASGAAPGGFAQNGPSVPYVRICPVPDVGYGGRHNGASIGMRGFTGFRFPETFAMRFAFMLPLCLLVACRIPDPPGPLIVRPSDLAKAYRDSPSVADTAYLHQVLLLPCEHCRKDHTRLVWSLGADADSPPVVVMEFAADAPTVTAGLWISGTCQGRTNDTTKRELHGFVFTVRVAECRVSPQPPPARP